ncbi:MAG: hypothetical protein QM813_05480 [Verrucomicrobiota bacterium]
MGILSNTKDRIIEQLALAYLNSTLLTPYGRATKVRIDSTAKTINIVAELHGETTPLEVEITSYEIRQEGEDFFAEIRGIRTSREWLTALAINHLQAVAFKLPTQIGRLLARAL